MADLTPQDRELIQNQIVECQQSGVLLNPAHKVDTSVDQVMEENATPDKQEEKRVRKKIKRIWRNWRSTVLDSRSLEIEKIACQIKIARAETKSKLDAIKRANEIEKAKHWLALNEGNLKDIGANTESRPHIFWYGLRRFFHHVTKLTDNVPKIFKNLILIGFLFLGVVLLKKFGIL